MQTAKVTKSSDLDMSLVRAVLQTVQEEDVRTKAAKIIQWDTQSRESWLLGMADPYNGNAGDADPVRVALVLCRCGYNGRFAAFRAVPQISYVKRGCTGLRKMSTKTVVAALRAVTNH